MPARANGVGNLQIFDAAEDDDVAGAGFGDRRAREALEAVELHELRVALRAVALHERHGHVALHDAAADSADAHQADVGVVVEARYLQLKWPFELDGRRRHVVDDGLEQRLHVAVARRRIGRRIALQRGRVDHGKVELLVARTEPVEEIERLVEHPVRAGAFTIDLVDHDERREAVLERLARDETSLRHRPVHCVDEQQHAVDHRQHALDLAAEVRVPRRVDDVDAPVVPADRGVLREDRDAALFLEVVRVHRALGYDRARIERVGLTQQLVDERGLAVIHVRDDRDVSQPFLGQHEVDRGEGKKARIIRPFARVTTGTASSPAKDPAEAGSCSLCSLGRR